ncbi:MAG: hypothetical protein UR73_C0007G0010 [candidate division WS6 bacterium GW2011_GWF1_35_23]|uniref:DUF3800 domain-containing protein n=1 Tax=candidate division WS6 bacterium GW2011_GWF1_35_23 TaxID=1619097 RepID=A0A0G0ES18_9BACT|nr:MAG: hypothetical protein UR73_C0007G0010 [candidate division WS6 bacterium GW2011_GWF1_35_23]
MIIFIDESGDLGFKIDKGSSKYLVISMVIFHNEEDMTEAISRISLYRKKMKYSSTYEFKFRKSNKKVIVGLLNAVKSCKFTVRTIVLKKNYIKESKLLTKTKIYDHLLLIFLEKYIKDGMEMKIRLDGSADREFTKKFKAYIRKKSGVHKQTFDFKIIDSKNDILIQLADVVVGSVRRSYTKEKNDSNIYKSIINDRIEEEVVLGKSDLAPILE